MICGGFGVIDMGLSSSLPSPSGRRVGDEGPGHGATCRPSASLIRRASPATFSQREKGGGASLPLCRPVYVVRQRERGKLRIVARRVDARPCALAGDVLIFARPAQERDDAAFRTLVGHEEFVAVAVSLDANAIERVTLGPRLRFLHAADGEIVQKLRPVARLHNAGAFGGGIRAYGSHVDDHSRATDRIGRELRCAAYWKRIGGERRWGGCNGVRKNQECT